MKMVTFTVVGEPFGKQRPKFSSRGQYVKAYTPKATVDYENWVKLQYSQKYKDKMLFDVDEPLAMNIRAYMSTPKSVSKKKHNMMIEGLILPTKKPDWDNIAKIIGDALNKIAYPDDKQIVKALICKKYIEHEHENPRVEIEIFSLKQDEG